MEKSNVQGYKTFGIIGFVIAILSLIFSWIPCIGSLAMIPSIIALVLSILAYSKVSKAGESAGLFIAGIVIAAAALVLSILQYTAFSTTVNAVDEMNTIMQEMKTEGTDEALNEALESLGDEFDKELQRKAKEDSLKNLNH